MKQSAVEWLIKELEKKGSASLSAHYELFQQSKEMEKQQIVDAWEDGQNSFPTINAEKYYKETFKNK
jgi:hypothetical protein